MRGRRHLAVVVMAGVALAGCGGDDSAEDARDLRRRQAGEKLAVKGIPKGGDVPGNVVELELSGAGVKLAEPEGDTSGRSGHYVVFVDREPVAMGEKIPDDRDVVEATEPKVQLTGLTIGPHEVAVVLADGAHRRMGEKVARAEMNVKGPSVQASASDAKPKQPVILSLTVEGVTVAEPNGDTSGATGHFAVFVDREPTAAGEPVPKERGVITTAQQTIAVHDLGAGEHELWVAMVNGAAAPLDPMVADKVVVEVG